MYSKDNLAVYYIFLTAVPYSRLFSRNENFAKFVPNTLFMKIKSRTFHASSIITIDNGANTYIIIITLWCYLD